MIRSIVHGFGLALIAFCILTSLTGCATLFTPAQTAAVKSAVTDPNNIAKASQDGVQIAATAFLARNPTYAGDVTAAADVLLALAASNPSAVTTTDIAAALAKTSISISVQAEVASYAASALGLFENDFQVSFPTLKPNYSIYLDAVANGLNLAQGKTAAVVTLPVIPWPPATTTVTPAATGT